MKQLDANLLNVLLEYYITHVQKKYIERLNLLHGVTLINNRILYVNRCYLNRWMSHFNHPLKSIVHLHVYLSSCSTHSATLGYFTWLKLGYVSRKYVPHVLRHRGLNADVVHRVSSSIDASLIGDSLPAFAYTTIVDIIKRQYNFIFYCSIFCNTIVRWMCKMFIAPNNENTCAVFVIAIWISQNYCVCCSNHV
jgi:hypothetical protein